MTDDGATIDSLQQEGGSLDNPKRQKMLEVTLKGFGGNISAQTLKYVRFWLDESEIRYSEGISFIGKSG